MIKHALLALTLWLNATPPAVDPLDGLVPDPIDIEVDDAPIGDVLMLAGDITGVSIEIDPCVQGKVSFKLKGVRVRTLLETLADTLALEYRRDADGTLNVGCREVGGESAAIDLEVADAPVADVVELLAELSGRALAVDGCEGKQVDLAVENASIDAVLSMLSTRLDASLVHEDEGLTLRCDSLNL